LVVGVAALARLLLGDLPGVQVGVDRHLLARHGVEGEAGTDLGDAPGAVRDDHEVDDDEDEEDDEADDHVAADDELAERLHDVTGVALEEDEPRDADVDGQAEHRRQQQEGGEGREVQRARQVQRRDDDGQRDRDVQRDEQVEQERRQRHHQHHDDQDDEAGRDEIGVLHDLLQRAGHAATLLLAVR
jgi:hypothetical protein